MFQFTKRDIIRMIFSSMLEELKVFFQILTNTLKDEEGIMGKKVAFITVETIEVYEFDNGKPNEIIEAIENGKINEYGYFHHTKKSEIKDIVVMTKDTYEDYFKKKIA